HPLCNPRFWGDGGAKLRCPRDVVTSNGGDYMSQATWTMQLSSEMQQRAEALRKEGQTHRELMEQIFSLGLYQLEYRQSPDAKASRKAYQDKRREEDKLARAILKAAQSNPEMATKLGLGTRVAL